MPYGAAGFFVKEENFHQTSTFLKIQFMKISPENDFPSQKQPVILWLFPKTQNGTMHAHRHAVSFLKSSHNYVF